MNENLYILWAAGRDYPENQASLSYHAKRGHTRKIRFLDQTTPEENISERIAEKINKDDSMAVNLDEETSEEPRELLTSSETNLTISNDTQQNSVKLGDHLIYGLNQKKAPEKKAENSCKSISPDLLLLIVIFHSCILNNFFK